MASSYNQIAHMFLNFAQEKGVKLTPQIRILDFGCGSGDLVKEFLGMNLNVYGVDVKDYWKEKNEESLNSRCKMAGTHPYHLPYEDNEFDFILSNFVFEHIFNYEEAFQEIRRILKPGGTTIHIFPGPWCLPVEPHMYVPLASVVQWKWWLSLWAILGIRNEFQKGLPWKEVAKRNKEYCETGIHYEPRKKVRNMIEKIFGNIQYLKKEYVRHSPSLPARIGRRFPIPGYATLTNSFVTQVIFMQKLPQY